MQLVRLQSQYDEIVAAGGEVVAISTDNLSGAERSVQLFGAEYPILYTAQDPTVPQSYGVFNLFGDGLASASIFLVVEGNEIAWQSIGRNYQHQVDPHEIIEQLNLLRS